MGCRSCGSHRSTCRARSEPPLSPRCSRDTWGSGSCSGESEGSGAARRRHHGFGFTTGGRICSAHSHTGRGVSAGPVYARSHSHTERGRNRAPPKRQRAAQREAQRAARRKAARGATTYNSEVSSKVASVPYCSRDSFVLLWQSRPSASFIAASWPNGPRFGHERLSPRHCSSNAPNMTCGARGGVCVCGNVVLARARAGCV